MMDFWKQTLLGGAAVAVVMAAQPAHAQTKSFDVPAQPAATGVAALARQADVQILISASDARGRTVNAVRGDFSVAEAIGRLLEGTGLQARSTGAQTWVVVAAAAGNDQGAGPVAQVGEIVVTGTRIRGGDTASPVVRISAEQIKEEGFTDLGEVIRSVPQNFSGGQNPGVLSGNITGAGTANQNITGGSGLNLRGLGSDATLTLLNGRRMSYGGFVPSVDISAIPVEAVQRIEIVADGASAIYGSDAVGGVANVILRQDYDGLTVGARYGGATEGGLETQEYTLTGGFQWNGGGMLFTAKNTSVDPLYSDQRSYAEQLVDPSTLAAGSDLRSGLISLHQSVGGRAELRLDAYRTERSQLHLYNYNGSNSRVTPETTSTLVAPSVEIALPFDWTVAIGGAWAEDEHIQYRVQRVIATGVTSIGTNTCYCNESRTYEIGGEGPIFSMPAGDARLAVGIGYRRNAFEWRNRSTGTLAVDGDEASRFAYAEANIPLLAEAQSLPAVHRLALTLAVRGEDYDSFGSVTTPKIGVVYDPTPDFTVKGSWGRSFKAPTLYQMYSARTSQLNPVSYFGVSGYGANATVLTSGGGNADLSPEKATTWSVSAMFHPRSVRNLQAEITWFDIDYRDRVVQPIPNFPQALSNPNYADFVNLSPTADQQAALIAGTTFYNLTTQPYDPADVVAIVSSEYLNAARQRISGIDLNANYRVDIGESELAIRGSVSWLESDQQNSPAQTPYDLAGTLFNPAELSGRLGLVWRQDGFSGSVFGNYRSGVTDTVQSEEGASFTTLDTVFQYSTGDGAGPASGLSFVLSIQNIFDRDPPLYTPAAPLYVAPYDSTNYSAMGRLISLSVSKHF